MVSGWYVFGARDVADRTIDLIGDTLKVMLVGAGYIPDPDHDFVSDVNAQELNGTGYANGFGGAGRKTLAGKAFATDLGNNRVEFTFDPVLWAAINAGTAAYAIII